MTGLAGEDVKRAVGVLFAGGGGLVGGGLVGGGLVGGGLSGVGGRRVGGRRVRRRGSRRSRDAVVEADRGAVAAGARRDDGVGAAADAAHEADRAGLTLWSTVHPLQAELSMPATLFCAVMFWLATPWLPS